MQGLRKMFAGRGCRLDFGSSIDFSMSGCRPPRRLRGCYEIRVATLRLALASHLDQGGLMRLCRDWCRRTAAPNFYHLQCGLTPTPNFIPPLCGWAQGQTGCFVPPINSRLQFRNSLLKAGSAGIAHWARPSNAIFFSAISK